jgi:isochorismate synthase EntC
VVRIDTKPDIGSGQLAGVALSQEDASVLGAAADLAFSTPEYAIYGIGTAIEVSFARRDESDAERVRRFLLDGKFLEPPGGKAHGFPAPGPIVFFSIPFHPSAPTILQICRQTFVVASDNSWCYFFGSQNFEAQPPPPAPPEVFYVYTPQPVSRFLEAVSQALAEVSAGRIEKIVLARQLVVEGNAPIPPWGLFRVLQARFSSTYVYRSGAFVGASPELLIARKGNEVRSLPLAGTILDQGRRDESKILREHIVVRDFMGQRFAEIAGGVEIAKRPEIVRAGELQHYGTRVSGTLLEDHQGKPLFELAHKLHPTPAICGSPADAALNLIPRLEHFERELYGGAFGWQDRFGQGEVVLVLRCARVNSHRATLYAGAGIVTGSDPELELLETQAKLEPLVTSVLRLSTTA